MKIGILTHYYKSLNYGGNLQAYSLITKLKKQGYCAEQISFSMNNKSLSTQMNRDILFYTKHPLHCVKAIIRKIENRYHNVLARRKIAFSKFNQNTIPHSKEIYQSDSIQNYVEHYDVFITGSDQVWNFTWYNSEFFLDFVPSDKIKLSYAASLACDTLTDSQKKIFLNSLKDFKAVSVREKSAVELISELSPVPVENVLDPTLLLDKEDWDEICSDRIVAEDYLFCYFLGENKKSRKLAERFAKQNNLKLVTIPHAGGWIKLADRNFGDIRLFDATPNDFISLIKHAKYVFTDSFHAVVFSYIYQKQYFVFNRNRTGEMSSRIQDITELFCSEDHFCSNKERECLSYIQALPSIDYTQANPTFERLRQESIEFLKRNLGDTEE